MMTRRLLPVFLFSLLTAVLVLPAQATESETFPRLHTYEDQFQDVSPNNWFYDNVAALYELGLTNGQNTPDRFAPDDNMTVAEAITMAARLRSLYEHRDSEVGPAAFSGGRWYEPYVRYLQSLHVIGTEFDGQYQNAADRAQVARILVTTLPATLFEEINAGAVTVGYASRSFITDVNDYTPYRSEILQLYRWGILSGMDNRGSFHPAEPIQRSQVAAMVTRLVYPELRLTLNWDTVLTNSREGTAMWDLVSSDGTFHAAPAPEDLQAIDDNLRYMLSRGERQMFLSYGMNMLTEELAQKLMSTFISSIRLYIEQSYNQIQCSYSPYYGSMTVKFSSSLLADDLLEDSRSDTMAAAIAIHDQMWLDGVITAATTEYEKARIYFTWLCENCVYDYSADDASLSHSGYSALVDGLAVCDGYTAAYNLLLKLEGIECSTRSTEDHIWTVATLDGTEYHIDLTWGDQTGTIAYRYFAMTEAVSMARFN